MGLDLKWLCGVGEGYKCTKIKLLIRLVPLVTSGRTLLGLRFEKSMRTERWCLLDSGVQTQLL